MSGTTQDYFDADQTCEAYVSRPNGTGPFPVILVAHQWAGQTDHERETADWAASLGYIGVAIDVYGKGKRGLTEGDDAMAVNSALMTPFLADRAALRQRLLAAVGFAATIEGADASRIGVMGFCFGGLCALDVARSGTAKVRGVVSIHGIFAAPNLGSQPPIRSSALVLHGWEDPMAPPQDVLALAKELTEAGADWQLHAYGHAMHAYTAKGANMPERGLKYDAKADRRTRQATQNFFAEIFV